MGYFRNIPHIKQQYLNEPNYIDDFKKLIDTYITDKRTVYSNFNEIITNLQSNKDINVSIASILSMEHIKNPDDTYTCMGDLYKSENELMTTLLVCEYFDKNNHMYGDNQNYVIKRQLRDDIVPNKKSKKKQHSD